MFIEREIFLEIMYFLVPELVVLSCLSWVGLVSVRMARFLFKFWLFTPHSFRCFVCYKLFCCHELKFSQKTFTVHRATWEIENMYIYIYIYNGPN